MVLWLADVSKKTLNNIKKSLISTQLAFHFGQELTVLDRVNHKGGILVTVLIMSENENMNHSTKGAINSVYMKKEIAFVIFW